MSVILRKISIAQFCAHQCGVVNHIKKSGEDLVVYGQSGPMVLLKPKIQQDLGLRSPNIIMTANQAQAWTAARRHKNNDPRILDKGGYWRITPSARRIASRPSFHDRLRNLVANGLLVLGLGKIAALLMITPRS